jgi:ArsR family transcriptional regulator
MGSQCSFDSQAGFGRQRHFRLTYPFIRIYSFPMENTVHYFRALGDETRLRIMALLLASGELCVCDLTATLQLPQSTVSRHLSYLKNAGWLKDHREGVWIFYTVAADSAMKRQLADILKERLPELAGVEEDFNRLASFGKGSHCA